MDGADVLRDLQKRDVPPGIVHSELAADALPRSVIMKEPRIALVIDDLDLRRDDLNGLRDGDPQRAAARPSYPLPSAT